MERLKRVVKRLLPEDWLNSYREQRNLVWRIKTLEGEVRWLKANQQYLLREVKAHIGPESSGRATMLAHEFRAHSQSGEDGLLHYVFGAIGTTDKKCVEIGVEDGRMCNTANLIINHGWKGLLIDCNREDVFEGRRYYGSLPGVGADQVSFAESFVTAEDVNKLIGTHGFSGPIDLLSIDIDGNDYWVWKAVSVVDPRVVIVEYNAVLGTELSVAVRYRPDALNDKYPTRHNWGASLRAYARLAESKGYRLVACTSSGVNALFVKSDLAGPSLPAIAVEEAYYPCEYYPQTEEGLPPFDLDQFEVV